MPLSDAEVKEMQELERVYGNARPQLQGLNDAEKAELENLEKQYGPHAPMPQATSTNPQLDQAMNDVGMTGGLTLHPLAKSLDYLAGIGRTVAGAGLGAATGNDVIQNGDLARAATGEAVPGSELLKRADIPEGPHANLFPEVKIPFTDVTLGKGDTSARDAAGFALETATDPLTYLTLGGAGAAKGLSPVAKATENAGEALYKSGLKRADIEAAKYGKEPVSDVLAKEGVWGKASTIQKEMDRLGAERLASRDALLAEATKRGGEVSMRDAMRPLQAEIEKIKISQDPELQKLAKTFQGKAKKYIALDAKEAQPEYRSILGYKKNPEQYVELPTSFETTVAKPQAPLKGYVTQKEMSASTHSAGDFLSDPNTIGDITTITPIPENLPSAVKRNLADPVIDNPVDKIQDLYRGNEYVPAYQGGPSITKVPGSMEVTYGREIPSVEAVKGPTPVQASGFKTTAGANLPRVAWQDYKINTAAQQLTKAMQSGLRKETEQSVGKALGKPAEKDLIKLNDELGRILTTREKQAMDAAIETKKNYFTSVDGGLAGNMLRDPVSGALIFGGKKAGDLFKTTAFRTGVGKGLNRLGAGGRTGPIMDILARRGFASPWQSMETKKKNGR